MEMHKQILEEMDAKELAQMVCHWQNEAILHKQENKRLRDLVLQLSGAVNIDDEWARDNEPTENILRACYNRVCEATLLIGQGVRMLRP